MLEVYLVGGYIRDTLLGIPSKDKDHVVVNSSKEELLKLGFTCVGKSFPVFLHPKTKEEYALCRLEHKTGVLHGDFAFVTEQVTLQDDLKRRDFTINAIALAEKNAALYFDPYNGIKDLQHKKLRHISSAFQEDPLRVLRLARFAAKLHSLGFTVAPETQELAKNMVSLGMLQHLPKERCFLELKNALKTSSPAVFFYVLHTTNALQDTFPLFNKQALLQEINTIDFAKIQDFKFLKNQLDDISPEMVDELHVFLNLAGIIVKILPYITKPELTQFLAMIPAKWGKFISKTYQHSKYEFTAQHILDLVYSFNALQDITELKLFVHLMQAVLNRTDLYALDDLLLNLKTVKADNFVKLGFTGKAIGIAIKEQQLRIIKDFYGIE